MVSKPKRVCNLKEDPQGARKSLSFRVLGCMQLEGEGEGVPALAGDRGEASVGDSHVQAWGPTASTEAGNFLIYMTYVVNIPLNKS